MFELCKSILDPDYEICAIHDSISGIFGPDASSLYEILSGRSNAEITKFKKTFAKLYKESLVDEIGSKSKGLFKILLTVPRNEDMIPTQEVVQQVFTKLHSTLTGINIATRDRKRQELMTLLCENSYPVLNAAMQMFKDKPVHERVKSNFTGDVEMILLSQGKKIFLMQSMLAETWLISLLESLKSQ